MTKQNGGFKLLKYQIDFFKNKTIREPPLLGAISESILLTVWRTLALSLVAVVVVARLARIVHLTRQIVAHQLLDLASLASNDLNAVAFEHALGTCAHISRQHNSHTLSL